MIVTLNNWNGKVCSILFSKSLKGHAYGRFSVKDCCESLSSFHFKLLNHYDSPCLSQQSSLALTYFSRITPYVSLLHWVSIYITAPVIAPWQFISYISSMLHPFYLPLFTNPLELIHWIPQCYKAVSSLLKPHCPKCSIPESHVFIVN